ncbi:MAG: hypothetical protein IJT34_03945, partial [Butyrivibrio sp.]|nr:hypothetical protein [Butyrivibrio sp.]
LKIGEDHMFFRSRLKWYVVPYSGVDRCFRRVRNVPARLCCGRGSLDMESIVVSQNGRELAEIQMPGARAAVAAFEELKGKMPGAAFGRPEAEAKA